MVKFFFRRLLLMIPVLLGATVVIFTIMYFIPGDPAVAILGSTAMPYEVELLREQMGLNDPYILRLGRYLYDVYVRFDLGRSYLTGVPITTQLLERLPSTLLLGSCSIIVTVIVGIPLGINAAVHRDTIADWLPLSIALVGVSMPGFWFALMLVLIFAVHLKWLPAYGLGGVEYWILPILAGSFNGIASMARQARASVLDVINSDYVVMARAKGLSERAIIFKHVLPNAMIPIITIMGATFAGVLGSGMLVEMIFSVPGVGYFMVKSVNNRDYPAVQGSVLFFSIAFTLIMLLTDLAMAAVDPRIKAQFAGGSRKKERKEVTANG